LSKNLVVVVTTSSSWSCPCPCCGRRYYVSSSFIIITCILSSLSLSLSLGVFHIYLFLCRIKYSYHYSIEWLTWLWCDVKVDKDIIISPVPIHLLSSPFFRIVNNNKNSHSNHHHCRQLQSFDTINYVVLVFVRSTIVRICIQSSVDKRSQNS